MPKLEETIEKLLAQRQKDNSLRTLTPLEAVSCTTVLINGNKLINFASNDYLGLSQHPLLKERAIKAIETFGTGNPSSRLVSGNLALYDQIEAELARLKHTDCALIFPTGFQANATVLQALGTLNSKFFCDKLSHNSILLGTQFGKRSLKRFAHNDLAHLQSLLATNSNDESWIVTESVFSMDGDLAPLNDLLQITKNYQTHLYLDEAHATGVFGENGMGLLAHPTDNTIIMGTFGKACGSFGAYIACSELMKSYLINYCSGLIYTTALPPAVLASIQAALEVIPSMVSERKALLEKARQLNSAIKDIGYQTGDTQSQIISIYLGTSDLAISLSQYLAENGLYARAIRYPTVPENTARVRLSLSLLHSNVEIERLIDALNIWYAEKH